MGRSRIYESDAERKKAYRLRLSGQQVQNSPRVPPIRRPPSRPRRLATALSEVEALQHEYEDWLSAMPESLQDSNLANRLQEVIDKLAEVAELLSDIDVPKGFGRD